MAPGTSDAVHRYFEYNETTQISTCELCKNKLKGKHTTNLKSHLATKHTNEYQIVVDLNSKAARPGKFTKGDDVIANNIETLKKNCVKLVTVHGRPLAMMEDAAFQNIIDMAAQSNTGHKHINVKAIKSKIHDEAQEIKQKIVAEVKNRMICLKLDAATCQERKFIGINIQYIKNDKIIVRNLSVLEVTSSQTSEFLKTTLEDILLDFMILPEQLYCICTDNGNNMIKMVKLIGGSYVSEDYQEEEISDDEDSEEGSLNEEDDRFNTTEINIENFIANNGVFKVRGMLCAAHTLQLAVKDAFNQDVEAQAITGLARTIVNILRKPNNMNHLRRQNMRKPIKDCATRWTSTFNMLVRLAGLRNFCENVPELSLLISDQFWGEVADLVKCLQPATKATIKLQSEQLTMGDFYITWLSCKSETASIEHRFANALHTSMAHRETKLLENDVVLEALYVDTRLNLLLSPAQCQKARSLLQEVHKQSNHVKNVNIEQQSDIESIDVMNTIGEPMPGTSTDLSPVEAMLRTRENARSRSNVMQRRSFDVCLHDLYTCPRIDLKENILKHWQNKTFSNSELGTVANIVLGAPATQVSVERLFSSLKFILHPLRTNLSRMFLKEIMLVRANKDLL